MSKILWVKRHQCPCGDRKCFVVHEDETDQWIEINESETMAAEPCVGMVFESENEAYEYYCNFGRQSGFAVVKGRSKRSPELGVYKRDFYCYKKSIKCPARMKLSKAAAVDGGVSQWSVKKFTNVHNHELLTRDEVLLLPAYRNINDADIDKILLLSRAGVPIPCIAKGIQLEKGIHEGVNPYFEDAVKRVLAKQKAGCIQEHDEKRDRALMEIQDEFVGNERADKRLLYDYIIDEISLEVENIAWSSHDYVDAYYKFGDVVYFDTTYCSLTYNMPFGAWLGINNHGKLVVFGYCLLRNATTGSFTWALEAFFKFTGGRYPQTIVTDTDPCLKEAIIRRKLPNTKHVIAMYNIEPKISSWFSLPLGQSFPEFEYVFKELCKLESTDKFESRWGQVVSHFRLNSNKHIALLSSLRMCWALPYTRGYFLARMDCTSYRRAVDMFLKGVIETQTCSLLDFLKQTTLQLGISTNSQSQDEVEYMDPEPLFPIEEHARNILTPFAFNELEKEVAEAVQYEESKTENGRSYIVRHLKKDVDVERLLTWTPEVEEIQCSCKEFESTGILCRHALHLLINDYTAQIPNKYLLNRWRRSVT